MSLLKKFAVVGLLVLGLSLAWPWMNSVDIKEFYKGKTVILAGASKGIGKSLAIKLSKLGAKLVIAARTVDKLTETQNECLKNSPNVHTVIADVSKEEDCKAIVDKAVEVFGGVDILILNAARVPTPQWFTDFDNPATEFLKVFSVNVLQSVYLVRYALPHLNQSQGIIVPVSSASGLMAIPKVSPYTTSKHALNGFFKGLNQEFVLTQTPISITIMPLPYVLTEKAIDNWKPIGDGGGMSTEDCTDRMLHCIPQRRLWNYIDWQIWSVAHLYSLCPSFFDWFVRQYLPMTSHHFS